MNKQQFISKLKKLKKAKPQHDYRLELYRDGVTIAYIYGDGNLDAIEVEDHITYLFVYTDTFGVLVDDAEVVGI